MKYYLGSILALMKKDLLLEFRTRDTITPVVVFALLVVIIFNFAIEPTPKIISAVAPGVLWVAFTFSGILGLNRSFILEKDKGSLEGLILCPVSRDVIFFGKMLASLVFMLTIEALIFPIFGLLFNVPLFIPEAILIAILATIAFASLGTVFSAVAVGTRSREIMLPILFFPFVAPIIIAAVESTGVALKGKGLSDMGNWPQLIAVFDVVFLVASAFVFQFTLEE